MTSYGLLVIGSGPAGVSAAQAYLAAGGPGPVVLLTADQDEPYERPPLSKDSLAGPGEPARTPISEAKLPKDVELRLGTTVTAIDLQARTVTAGEETLGFQRLIVATGSRPLPLAGADADADIHTLRFLEDARRLTQAADHGRTALVIGSGFIGCEAAASLARRGLQTTLVTPESGPQQKRLGSYAAQQITSWLTDLGIEVRTGVEVTGVQAPRTVHLSDGHTLAPDLILAAVGIAPQGDLLGDAGVQTHQGRVVVDEHLQAAPGVWVAGDVARGLHGVAQRALSVEHWGDALAMGEVAGANAAAGDDGAQQTWSETPGFWSTIGEHTLQYSAWGDGYEHEEVVERVGGFTIWYADADQRVVGVLTYNAEPDYERGGRLIAAGATLEQALRGDDAPEPDAEPDADSDEDSAEDGAG